MMLSMRNSFRRIRLWIRTPKVQKPHQLQAGRLSHLLSLAEMAVAGQKRIGTTFGPHLLLLWFSLRHWEFTPTGREDIPALRSLTLTSPQPRTLGLDRKSTRLNSSHPSISYAVFCLKKKK